MTLPAPFDVPVGALVRSKEAERNRLRSARPRTTRARTVGLRRTTRAMLDVGRALFPEQPGLDYERPKTRGECADGPRPCPYVSCRFHLFLDVNRAGGLKLNFPDLDVVDMAESCALDVADRGGVTLDAIRDVLNVTREAVRLIEERALAKLLDAARALDEERLRAIGEGSASWDR